MSKSSQRLIINTLLCLLLAAELFLLCLANQHKDQPAIAEAAPEPQTFWVSGRVVSVSSQSFLLRDDNGLASSFTLPQEEQQDMQPGCRVSLGYQQENGQRRIIQLHVSQPSLEERAQLLLERMTLEEKIGQLLLARCPAQDGAVWVEKLQLGGYILFDRDFQGHSPEQLRADIASYQQSAKLGLFIAVDEEGGSVVRASRYTAFRESPFASSQKLYAQGGFTAIADDAREKCQLLQALGVNLNLAPVADVSTDSRDFIYSRSFGQGGAETAAYVQTVVEIMEQEHLGSVLKHFPGYGSNKDTHNGAAYDQRPYESFLSQDFLPFQAGIRSGATMVMVSHNTVCCMDAEHPASLSPAVIRILREELGFSGVIITDDLAMAAAKNPGSEYSTAVQAVLAGNDMLCSSDFVQQYQELLAAAQNGVISQEQLDRSVLRILAAKLALGIIR